ncbi:hypothetical protein BJ138DRAFT_1120800 [Hygrophoropsis aurantiaca]|uniref:Uncharacterized protein n=1 Tax=Hygrophoropsis aurantiaca TaxID=72124 RepID=A0ACB7ZQA5_9AGAM|nr:hypothetical protein BJ138DRAFT_1120800 [Hygrophoropsis aurantiaca]
MRQGQGQGNVSVAQTAHHRRRKGDAEPPRGFIAPILAHIQETGEGPAQMGQPQSEEFDYLDHSSDEDQMRWALSKMAENRVCREAEEALQLQTAMATSRTDYQQVVENNRASCSNTHEGASGSNAQAGASSSSSHTTSSREIVSYHNINMVATGDLPHPGIDKPETDMDIVYTHGVPCLLWEISENLEYRFTGADKAEAGSNIQLGVPPSLDNVRQTVMPLLKTYERWQELYDQARDDRTRPARLGTRLGPYEEAASCPCSRRPNAHASRDGVKEKEEAMLANTDLSPRGVESLAGVVPPQGEDVVKHLAACGVSYAQVDDLQYYAQNWMSECLEHDSSYLTEDECYLCEDRLFIATDPDSYPTRSLDDSSATAGAGAQSWSGSDGTFLGPINDPMLSPNPYGDELDFDEPTPQ